MSRWWRRRSPAGFRASFGTKRERERNDEEDDGDDGGRADGRVCGAGRVRLEMEVRDMKRYLAIDIGASSGRHILGSVVDGKITLEEVYRFEN